MKLNYHFQKILLIFFIVCSIFISCISSSNIKKKELIGLNPELYNNNNRFEFIGKINLSSNRFLYMYLN